MSPIQVAQLLACALFSILFLQSGIDKVVDWKGNLEWLTGHFSKTALRGAVPAMLGTVTLLELAAGATSGVGGIWLFMGKGVQIAIYGLALCGLALTMLFFGQRVAKDYPGAATLATYFGVVLFGLYLMGQGT